LEKTGQLKINQGITLIPVLDVIAKIYEKKLIFHKLGRFCQLSRFLKNHKKTIFLKMISYWKTKRKMHKNSSKNSSINEIALPSPNGSKRLLFPITAPVKLRGKFSFGFLKNLLSL